jgi:hypothetical protein
MTKAAAGELVPDNCQEPRALHGCVELPLIRRGVVPGRCTRLHLGRPPVPAYLSGSTCRYHGKPLTSSHQGREADAHRHPLPGGVAQPHHRGKRRERSGVPDHGRRLGPGRRSDHAALPTLGRARRGHQRPTGERGSRSTGRGWRRDMSPAAGLCGSRGATTGVETLRATMLSQCGCCGAHPKMYMYTLPSDVLRPKHLWGFSPFWVKNGRPAMDHTSRSVPSGGCRDLHTSGVSPYVPDLAEVNGNSR